MVNWNRMKELTQLPGVPGAEGEVREVLSQYIANSTSEMLQDRLGGLFGVLRGKEKSPKVMVAGHMDEVGFMVTRITEKGFLKFQTLGGWWSQVMLAQRIQVVTRSGKRIPGVIGSIPTHLLKPEMRKKPIDVTEMFIDVGADSADEVEALGICPGDAVAPYFPDVEMAGGTRILSKAWDNRFGCGIALELLDALKGQKHPNTVFSGATVQEEVGLRGAQVAAQMIQPDVFFAVDAGPAGDTPGVSDGYGQLGKGVVIRLMDRSMVPLPGMREFLIETAKREGIPYQFFVSQGGTDAGAVHTTGEGVPSAALGVCARYIHSHAAMIDKDDVEATKRFLVAAVKSLDAATLEAIRKG
ncbi:M42 family metallopeptidase [Marininema halotolerans]|uniref:Putative aminopeptidase FrvX n=1 Tax=Marininema halotolerans TaxID=1155944 RepID=A0A1I6R842_9BACL|nr:M42 family metallopeptidase [Marininema halotolerans]SFS60872.1 Putative aminopeptidase FrvX [Marininema halotolerans]